MRARDLRDYLTLHRLATNAWATLRFRKRQRPGDVHTVQMRGAPVVRLRGDRADFHMFHRIFLSDEYRLRDVPPASWKTVVDLGGNVGLFAVRVAPLAARVLSYEPYKDHFACLQRNTQHWPNIEAVCAAVSGRPGPLRLYEPLSPRASGSYSMFPELGHHVAKRWVEVTAVTLGDLFERHGVETCDLLKIDVEGQEYDILHAAPPELFERIARIHGEYHDVQRDAPRSRVTAFAGFLRGCGYSVELAPDRSRDNHGMFYATRH